MGQEQVVLWPDEDRRQEINRRGGEDRGMEMAKRSEQRRNMEQRRKKELRRQQELRLQKRKRRQVLFLACQGVFLAAIILLFIGIKIQLGKLQDAQAKTKGYQEAEVVSVQQSPKQSGNTGVDMDYADLWGMDQVDAPVKREPYEVLERLEELGQENEMIEAISNHAQAYPENMLEALANNPEMADFVTGYQETDGSVTGGLTEREKEQEFPLFLQWDPRWGYASYGDDSNIGLAGCGPVSLSMVLYYLTRDTSLTPDKVAAYSMENGYYMSGTGTLWALMEDVPAKYGIKVSHPGIEEGRMKQELDEGHVIICAMKPGDFTSAGHFIVIYGYDESGFLVNDPNCVARSRESWSFGKIGRQIKNLWSFEK